MGQLSAGEKARMQSNITISAERFADDFDEEFTKVFSTFSTELLNNENISIDVSTRLSNLNSLLIFPQMVSNIYLINLKGGLSDNLLLFNKNSNTFAQTRWPNKFNHIEKLTKDNSPIQLSSILSLLSLSLVPQLTEHPYMLIPISAMDDFTNNDSRMLNYLIVELDKNVITENLIPSLSKRYFMVDDQLLYDVAIITSDKDGTFYTSTQDNNEDFISQSEISVRIGYRRLDRYTLASSSLRLNEGEQRTKRVMKIIQVDQSITKEDDSMEQQFLKQINDIKPAIDQSSPLRLYLKRVAGNIDTLVSDARKRNLVISYIILILFGLSITFVYRTSIRAHKVAQQQIEFVAGLTHELRTPLATIRSAAENIKDGVVKEEGKIQQYGQLIYDEDKRLSLMIEQSLMFSGLSTNEQLLNLEVLHINKILEEVAATYKNNRIILNLNQIPQMNADSNAMRTVFQNLISNAIKYSESDKNIHISSTFNELSSIISITVTDHGQGIKSDELPFIFDLFFRGAKVRLNQVQGSGIGLSLVKKVVDLHKGNIFVESNINEGSQFTIELPIEKFTKELDSKIS